MYYVTYMLYGDRSDETFDTIEECREFIRERINSADHGDFAVYNKIEIDINITI